MLSTVNAQPYSRADWHWRINVAHRFGPPPPETVKGVLAKLDREGIAGAASETRRRRAEVVQMWGRPESDFRRRFRLRRNL